MHPEQNQVIKCPIKAQKPIDASIVNRSQTATPASGKSNPQNQDAGTSQTDRLAENREWHFLW
jgi:hypothetical protein